eukprot:130474-Ditylum_brightwellii.AAC.1
MQVTSNHVHQQGFMLILCLRAPFLSSNEVISDDVAAMTADGTHSTTDNDDSTSHDKNGASKPGTLCT